MVGLFALVLVGAVVAVVVSALNRRSRLVPVWAAAARELGLPPPTGGGLNPELSISGPVERWHLRVRERTGEDSTWIEYELGGLPGIPSGLSVKGEHAGARLPLVGKLFSGGQEQVDTGDLRFDDAFIVTGHDPDAVRTFLTDDRRRALLTLAQTCPKFRLRGAELTYRFDGDTARIGDVARPAQAMITAARAFTANPAPDGAVFPGPDARGTAGKPAEAPHATADPPLGPTEEPHPPADPGVVFPLPDRAPGPPSSDAVEPIARPADAAPADGREGSTTEPRVAPFGASPDGQASILSEVFGAAPGAGTTVFGEQLHGRPVRWSGTVVRAGRFANDLDLGPGPGTRAVVEVGRVDIGGYGPATIVAVVGLPADAGIATGDTVSFEGTVASFDHFARRVVVTDAALPTD